MSRRALLERMPQIAETGEPDKPSRGVVAFDSPEQLLEQLARTRIRVER